MNARIRAVKALRLTLMRQPSNRAGRKNKPARDVFDVVLFAPIVVVPLAVVVMVSVEVCTAFDTFAIKLDGVKVHVVPTGNHAHVKLTVPTYPPTGVKVKVTTAD